jgi:GGDEF domain-containing protein
VQEGGVVRPRDRGAELVASGGDAIADIWRELCRWDPLLPPDSAPPIASAVISAIAAALARPQPLGWGTDPEVEKVEVFATAVGSIDLAIGQLVCLREAVRRYMHGALPPEDELEVNARFHIVVDRAIGTAANRTVERLRDEAVVDALTGLPNRRALDRDVRREIARSERYGHHFALVVVDACQLASVNEEHGYAAGDEVLRRLAGALCDVLRTEDCAYRLASDEFVVLLPETGGPGLSLAERVRACGPPPFTWGSSFFPADGASLEELLGVAIGRRTA